MAGWAVGPVLSAETMTLLGRAISMARSALEARNRDVNEIVYKERIRMAEELHDGLTQIVAGAVLELEALRNRIEKDPAEAVATLDHSKAEMRRALADLRDVLFDLSQADEDRGALHDSLTHDVDDIVKRWRLPAHVAVAGDLSRVPTRTLSVALVVIREALTNTAKHAAATNVTVSLSVSDAELKVVVGDAGRGLPGDLEQRPGQARHFGLAMLRRRVREAGGSLTVHSRPGKGTRLIARLPTREVAS